ncbi:hypothetical protein QBC37DRAFT_80348 [Rhypophila decipiens]|uniref:Uncharacterized protein n=1 Tax=Rhypophila decipiens TaxID=261697 RepID=A0AAN6XYX1_9PEZI|nr:hypothetical protein QBC37DRAFT_80348 [Rhypophila decipiens]
MYLRLSLNLLATLTSMPMVFSFPLSELEQIRTLNERQGTPMPWILNGTCIVSTNICTVDWWLSNPPTTANYVCGRYIAPGTITTNPNKACPSDGHVCVYFPFLSSFFVLSRTKPFYGPYFHTD